MKDYGSTFIDKSTSIYLDITRFFSAFIVLIGHILQDNKMNEEWYGHYAVVIFFVLSGLVISETTARPGMTAKKYIFARSARMLSVTVPALFLGSILILFAPIVITDSYGIVQRAMPDLQPISLLSSLIFTNESWGLDFDAPLNEPYWSICYEVMYYVIFGVWIFASPKAKLPLLAFVLVIAGPRVLALFPVWLTGVFLSRTWRKYIMGEWPSLLLFVASAVFFCLFISLDIGAFIKDVASTHIPGWWRLDMSQTAISDFLLGLLVAINFSAFRGISHLFENRIARLAPAITYAASFTFALYLFHRPFTHIYGAWARNHSTNTMAHFLTQLAVITIICFALGAVTERKKDSLKAWLSARF